MFFSLGRTSPWAIRKPMDVFVSFCKNLGIPNRSIAPQIPYPLWKLMSSIFGKFEPNGIKKLPAPERSGGFSNGFFEFFVFGTEKNLQIDT